MKTWLRIAMLALSVLLAGSVEATPTRKTFRLFTSAATDTTAVGMADSSAWIPTANYEQMYLFLKPNIPCKVAIQIKTAGNSDTMAVAGQTWPDTASIGVWPWSAFTTTGGAGSDTLSVIQTTLPTAVQAGSNELSVYFPQIGAAKWAGPRGLYIPLRGRDGEWYWGQYTSIRLRVLTAYGATGAVVTWTATLKGISW